MRHAVAQIAAEDRKPTVIYCSTDPAHIASAHMLAIHPSVRYVIPHQSLCFGRDDWFEKKRSLQAKMREALRTKDGAIQFCQNMTAVKEDVEEVVILTGQCWGNAFGYASTWHRGALYAFDLESQCIKVVGSHGVGI